LSGLTPDVVNDRLNAVGGYQDTNLVYWPKIHEAIPELDFEWRGKSYDNARVLEAIAAYGGCLVEVDFDGNLGTRDTHWVVFIGGGRMIDPWTGTTESTGKYKPTGFSIIRTEAEMSERQKMILEAIGDENNFFLDGDPIYPEQLMTLTRGRLDGYIICEGEHAKCGQKEADAAIKVKGLENEVVGLNRKIQTIEDKAAVAIQKAKDAETALQKENALNKQLQKAAEDFSYKLSQKDSDCKVEIAKRQAEVDALIQQAISFEEAIKQHNSDVEKSMKAFYERWYKASGTSWIQQGLSRILKGKK